jgi:O-antigen ligase
VKLGPRLATGGLKIARPEIVGFAMSLLVAAALGFIVAGQIVTPSKRVIESLMALAVLVATVLLPSRWSVGFLLFLIPFPQYTTIGSTTVIFAFIIFAIWLLRVSLGYERRPIASGVELPLVILVLFFVISFLKVNDAHWAIAVSKFRIFISSVLIFYLVVNLIRTERDIHFILNALVLSFCFVAAVAIVELWIPRYAYIFDIIHVKSTQEATVEGARVGSVFGDYEMFAEYLAIFIPILLIRVLNEKIVLKQLVWVPLLGAAIVLLLATATRGGFISLIVGMIYLVWIARRIVNYQKLLPVIILGAILFYVAAIVLNRYTESASLFGRLGKTKFVSGMPDTRAQRWSEAWSRIVESPWIGHGPYYFIGVDEKNIEHKHSHSLFLHVSYLIGIPGALVLYWLLFRALRMSYRAAKRYATRRGELAYTVVLLSSILVIFLVDEVKIEFMRYDNTQQFTWTMLGLLLSASRVALRRADETERQAIERIESE